MAFNDLNSTKVGTKGSDVYTAAGVEDPRVALSVLLVQGCSPSDVETGLNAIIGSGDKAMLEDAFVLLFQTRDVRGGKGIRDATLHMMRHFLNKWQTRNVMVQLLDLIPEYGSWRDLKVLAMETLDSPDIQERILNLFHEQMLKDEGLMGAEGSLSLAAKYAPRECHEKSAEKQLAKELAQRMFPLSPKHSVRMKNYRQLVSKLNKVLDTAEVKMCGKNFADIEPAKVPGRCLQKNMKAFLNQPSTYKKAEHPRPSKDEDRVLCAEHFKEHMANASKGEAKVNGSKTVYPHELVKKVASTIGRHQYYDQDEDGKITSNMTQGEMNTIIGVWNQMVSDAKDGGGLGRSLAMCDFSGSMQSSSTNHDTPYWVSMAMGLLISELTTKEFKDTFLTFDSEPTLHKLPKGTIFDRVRSISGHIGQGGSTDFQKAMDLVLAQLKATRCRPGQEPENLIVLTDMNWDQACGSHQSSYYTGNRYRHVVKTDAWQTHVEMIREAFKRAGEDMWGSEADGGLGGWKMPTIVIWNIAATSTDFHAKADTEGVVMMSGWSPNLFKVLQTEGVVQWTPYQSLRVQLDDERYAPIRERVRLLLSEKKL